MTEYEAGYLQALTDVELTIQQMRRDRGAAPEAKAELLEVASLLARLIEAKKRRYGSVIDTGASDPLSGSF